MLRRLFPLLLLGFTYIIGQSYTIWDTSYYNSLGNFNWILLNPHPMPLSWNVKYLSEEINRIIEAIAFRLMLNNSIPFYRLASNIYLMYRILDIIFYFADFKTFNYWWVFIILALIEIVYWVRSGEIKINIYK